MRLEAACRCGAQIAASGPPDAIDVIEDAWRQSHQTCGGTDVTRFEDDRP